jgi:dienelactone hydrolase
MPIADPAGPPGATAETRAAWAQFIGFNTHRAFAIGPRGEGGAAWGARDLDTAKSTALANCARRAGAECRLYAVDLAIVDPARPWRPATEAPASLGIGGIGWEIAPDARYLWRGAAAAEGAIVFGHGRGDNDFRGTQPQTWVRHFNLAGYDVLRFDRHPNSDDTDRAAAWLRAGLAALRTQGYRRIVVAGQSRGGWNALQVLDTPGLADVAIAVAAAAHGQGGSMNLLAQADQLRTIVGRTNAPAARVAFVQFAGDPFVLNPDGRAALIRDRLGPRVAAVLLIDRPDGFSGHGAGHQWRFADRFGPCLVAFATAADPPRAC